MYIVYCTTNIENKFIYVGVHKCIDEHFDQYLGCGCYANKPSSYNQPKTRFQAAVKKYGPNKFKRITLKEFENEDDAYAFEAEIVNYSFLKRKDVYNQVLGGGGVCLNAVTCYQYDLEGKFIQEFNSQQDAANSVNRCVACIKAAIKNKQQSGGYYFSLDKVKVLDIKDYGKTNKIPVFQYSKDGTYDCCYESIADASRINNVGTSNIVRAIKLGYLCKNKYYSYEFTTNFSYVKNEDLKKLPVYQYDLSGKFIKEWESYLVAEKALNKSSGLKQALKLGRTFANYQWSFEKLSEMNLIEVKHSAHKVGQYDLNNNLIKIYNTVTECTKEFSGCRHVLQGKRKTSGGFIFRYIEE